MSKFYHLLTKVSKHQTYQLATIVGLLWLISFPQAAFAQRTTPFPLDIKTRFIPPYPVHLADLLNAESNLFIDIDNRTQTTYQIILTGTLVNEQADVRIATNPDNLPIQTLTVLPGLNSFNGEDLGAYFNVKNLHFEGRLTPATITRNQALPEGQYEFCLQAINAATLLPLSAQPNLTSGCALLFINYVVPPEFISPVCDSKLDPTTDRNLLVSWTLPTTGSIADIQYELLIVEAADESSDPNYVLSTRTTPDFFKETVEGTNVYNLHLDELTLVNGRRYVMQVTAIDPSGKIAFQNGGKSRACTFRYGSTISTDFLEKLDGLEVIPEFARLTGLRNVRVSEKPDFYLFSGDVTLELNFKELGLVQIPVSLENGSVDKYALNSGHPVVTGGDIRGNAQALVEQLLHGQKLVTFDELTWTPKSGLTAAARLLAPNGLPMAGKGLIQITNAGLSGKVTATGENGRPLFSLGENPVVLDVSNLTATFPEASLRGGGQVIFFDGQQQNVLPITDLDLTQGSASIRLDNALKITTPLIAKSDLVQLHLREVKGFLKPDFTAKTLGYDLELLGEIALHTGTGENCGANLIVSLDDQKGLSFVAAGASCTITNKTIPLGLVNILLDQLSISRFAYQKASKTFDIALSFDGNLQFPSFGNWTTDRIKGMTITSDGITLPAFQYNATELVRAKFDWDGFGAQLTSLSMASFTFPWFNWNRSTAGAWDFRFEGNLKLPSLNPSAYPACLSAAALTLRNGRVSAGAITGEVVATGLGAGCPWEFGTGGYALVISKLSGDVSATFANGNFLPKANVLLEGQLRLGEPFANKGETVSIANTQLRLTNGWLEGNIANLLPKSTLPIGPFTLNVSQSKVAFSTQGQGQRQAVLSGDAQLALPEGPKVNGSIEIDLLAGKFIKYQFDLNSPFNWNVPSDANPVLTFRLQRALLNQNGFLVDGRNVLKLPATEIGTTFDNLLLSLPDGSGNSPKIESGRVIFDTGFALEAGINQQNEMAFRAVANDQAFALNPGLSLGLRGQVSLSKNGLSSTGAMAAKINFNGRDLTQGLAIQPSNDFSFGLYPFGISHGQADFYWQNARVAYADNAGFHPDLAQLANQLLPDRLPLPSEQVAYLQLRENGELNVDIQNLPNGDVSIQAKAGKTLRLVVPALNPAQPPAIAHVTLNNVVIRPSLSNPAIVSGYITATVPDHSPMSDLSKHHIPLILREVRFGQGDVGSPAGALYLRGDLKLLGGELTTSGRVELYVQSDGVVQGNLQYPNLDAIIPLVPNSDLLTLNVARVNGDFSVPMLGGGSPTLNLTLDGGIQVNTGNEVAARADLSLQVTQNGLNVTRFDVKALANPPEVNFDHFSLKISHVRNIGRLGYDATTGFDFRFGLDIGLTTKLANGSAFQLPLNGIEVSQRGLFIPQQTIDNGAIAGMNLPPVQLAGFAFQPLALRTAGPTTINWYNGLTFNFNPIFDFSVKFPDMSGTGITPPDGLTFTNVSFQQGMLKGLVQPYSPLGGIRLPIGPASANPPVLNLQKISGELRIENNAQVVDIRVAGAVDQVPVLQNGAANCPKPTFDLAFVSGKGFKGSIQHFAPCGSLTYGPINLAIPAASLAFDYVNNVQQMILAGNATVRIGSGSSVATASGNLELDLLSGKILNGGVSINSPFDLSLPQNTPNPFVTFRVNSARLDANGFVLSGGGNVKTAGNGPAAHVNFSNFSLDLANFGILGGEASFAAGVAMQVGLNPMGFQLLNSTTPIPTDNVIRLTLEAGVTLNKEGLTMAGSATPVFKLAGQDYSSGLNFIFNDFAVGLAPAPGVAVGVTRGNMLLTKDGNAIARLDQQGFHPLAIGIVNTVVANLPAEIPLPSKSVAYLRLKNGNTALIHAVETTSGYTLSTPDHPISLVISGLKQSNGDSLRVPVTFTIQTDKSFNIIGGEINLPSSVDLQPIVKVPLRLTKLSYASQTLLAEVALDLPNALGNQPAVASVQIGSNGIGGSLEIGSYRTAYDASLPALTFNTTALAGAPTLALGGTATRPDVAIRLTGIKATFGNGTGTQASVALSGALESALLAEESKPMSSVFFYGNGSYQNNQWGFNLRADVGGLPRPISLGKSPFTPSAFALTLNDNELSVNVSGQLSLQLFGDQVPPLQVQNLVVGVKNNAPVFSLAQASLNNLRLLDGRITLVNVNLSIPNNAREVILAADAKVNVGTTQTPRLVTFTGFRFSASGGLQMGIVEFNDAANPVGLSLPADSPNPLLSFGVSRIALSQEGLTLRGEGAVRLPSNNTTSAASAGIAFNDLTIGFQKFSILSGNATLTGRMSLDVNLSPLAFQFIAFDTTQVTVDNRLRLNLSGGVTLDATGVRLASNAAATATLRFGTENKTGLRLEFANNFALSTMPLGVTQGVARLFYDPSGQPRATSPLAELDAQGFHLGGGVFAFLPARIPLPQEEIAFLQVKDANGTQLIDLQRDAATGRQTISTINNQPISLVLNAFKTNGTPLTAQVTFSVVTDNAFNPISGTVNLRGNVDLKAALNLPAEINSLSIVRENGVLVMKAGVNFDLPDALGSQPATASLTVTSKGFEGSAEIGTYLTNYNPAVPMPSLQFTPGAAAGSPTLALGGTAQRPDVAVRVSGIRVTFGSLNGAQASLAMSGTLESGLLAEANQPSAALFFNGAGSYQNNRWNFSLNAAVGNQPKPMSLGKSPFSPSAFALTLNDNEFSVKTSGKLSLTMFNENIPPLTVTDLMVGIRKNGTNPEVLFSLASAMVGNANQPISLLDGRLKLISPTLSIPATNGSREVVLATDVEVNLGNIQAGIPADPNRVVRFTGFQFSASGGLQMGTVEYNGGTNTKLLAFPNANNPLFTLDVSRLVLAQEALTIKGAGRISLDANMSVDVAFNDLKIDLKKFGIKDGSATLSSQFAVKADLQAKTFQLVPFVNPIPAISENTLRVNVAAGIRLDKDGLSFNGTTTAAFRFQTENRTNMRLVFSDGFAIGINPVAVSKGKASLFFDQNGQTATEPIATLDPNGFRLGAGATTLLPDTLKLPSADVAFVRLKANGTPLVDITNNADGTQTLKTRSGTPLDLVLPSLKDNNNQPISVQVAFTLTVNNRYEPVGGSIALSSANSLIDLEPATGLPVALESFGIQSNNGAIALSAGLRIQLPQSLTNGNPLRISATIDRTGLAEVAGSLGVYTTTMPPATATPVFKTSFNGAVSNGGAASGSQRDSLTLKIYGLAVNFSAATKSVKVSGTLESSLLKDGQAQQKAIFLSGEFAHTGNSNSWQFGIQLPDTIKLGDAKLIPYKNKPYTIRANESEFVASLNGIISFQAFGDSINVDIQELQVGVQHVNTTPQLLFSVAGTVTLPAKIPFDLFNGTIKGEIISPALTIAGRDIAISADGNLTVMEKTINFTELKVSTVTGFSVRDITLTTPINLIGNNLVLKSFKYNNDVTIGLGVKLPDPLGDEASAELVIRRDPVTKAVIFPVANFVFTGTQSKDLGSIATFTLGNKQVNVDFQHFHNSFIAINGAVLIKDVGSASSGVQAGGRIAFGTDGDIANNPGVKVGFDASGTPQVTYNATGNATFSFNYEFFKVSVEAGMASSSSAAFEVVLGGTASLNLSGVSGGIGYNGFTFNTTGITNKGKLSSGSLKLMNIVDLSIGGYTWISNAAGQDIEISACSDSKDPSKAAEKRTVNVTQFLDIKNCRISLNGENGSSTGGFSGGIDRVLFYKTTAGGMALYIDNANLAISDLVVMNANLAYETSGSDFLLRVAASAKLKNLGAIAVIGKIANRQGQLSFGFFAAANFETGIKILPPLDLLSIGGGFFYRPEQADISLVHSTLKNTFGYVPTMPGGIPALPSGVTFAAMIYGRVGILGGAGNYTIDGKIYLQITNRDLYLDVQGKLFGNKIAPAELAVGLSGYVKFTPFYLDVYAVIKGKVPETLDATVTLNFFVIEDAQQQLVWGIIGKGEIVLLAGKIPGLPTITTDFTACKDGFLLELAVQAKFSVFVISINAELAGKIWMIPNANLKFGAYFAFQVEIDAIIKIGAQAKAVFAVLQNGSFEFFALGRAYVDPFGEISGWLSISSAKGLNSGLGDGGQSNLVAEAEAQAAAFKQQVEALKTQLQNNVTVQPPFAAQVSNETLTKAGMNLHANMSPANVSDNNLGKSVYDFYRIILAFSEFGWVPQTVSTPNIGWVYSNLMFPPNGSDKPLLSAGNLESQSKAVTDRINTNVTTLRSQSPLAIQRLQNFQTQALTWRSMAKDKFDQFVTATANSPLSNVSRPTTTTTVTGAGQSSAQRAQAPSFDFDSNAASAQKSSAEASQEELRKLDEAFRKSIADVETVVTQMDDLLTAPLSSGGSSISISQLMEVYTSTVEDIDYTFAKRGDYLWRSRDWAQQARNQLLPRQAAIQAEADALGTIALNFRNNGTAEGAYGNRQKLIYRLAGVGADTAEIEANAELAQMQTNADFKSAYSTSTNNFYYRLNDLSLSAIATEASNNVTNELFPKSTAARQALQAPHANLSQSLDDAYLAKADILVKLYGMIDNYLYWRNNKNDSTATVYQAKLQNIQNSLTPPTITGITASPVKSRFYNRLNIGWNAQHSVGIPEAAVQVQRTDENTELNRFTSVGSRNNVNLHRFYDGHSVQNYNVGVRVRGTGGNTVIRRTQVQINVDAAAPDTQGGSSGQVLTTDNTPPSAPRLMLGTVYRSPASSAATNTSKQLNGFSVAKRSTGNTYYTKENSYLTIAASASDESDIAKFEYTVGTTIGGQEVNGWTELIGDRSRTSNNAVQITGNTRILSLVAGIRYYVSVRATNGQGLTGAANNSRDAIIFDPTPPTQPQLEQPVGFLPVSFYQQAYLWFATPIASSSSPYNPQISDSDWLGNYPTVRKSQTQSWAASTDTESGLFDYQYAITTTPQPTETDFKDSVTTRSAAMTLSYQENRYFHVRARNYAGAVSQPLTFGPLKAVDGTAPTSFQPSVVSTGLNSLSVNVLHPAIDPETKVLGYQYAIGTTMGGTDVRDWRTTMDWIPTQAILANARTSGSVPNFRIPTNKLPQESQLYVMVRAVNNAGIATTPAVFGPTVLDFSPPELPTISLSAGNGSNMNIGLSNLSDPESGISLVEYAIASDINARRLQFKRLDYTAGSNTLTQTIDISAHTNLAGQSLLIRVTNSRGAQNVATRVITLQDYLAQIPILIITKPIQRPKLGRMLGG